MKTSVNTVLKTKTFCISKSYARLREKEKACDIKFYQKLIVVLVSLSIILIFPESPKELENICESYNDQKICSLW